MDTPVLSIVVPCYNEAEVFEETCRRLMDLLEEMIQGGLISEDSFICFVDDGSADQTWALISQACKSSPMVRGLKLSRNFGHQNALLAGLIQVKDRCDCAISIDADLQQDESAMPAFVKAYCEGGDIVFGVRRDRSADGLLKRATASSFYHLMSWMGVSIIEHHADYRLMSRRALGALTQFSEGNIFLRGVVAQLGFRTSVVTFDVRPRKAGETKYPLMKMISFALSGITAFSIAPLRIIAFLGAVFTLFAMVMAVYVLISKFVYANAVPGWASIVLPIYILGGIQLFAAGVIGEYIGRIYLETKRRPRYIVEEDCTG